MAANTLVECNIPFNHLPKKLIDIVNKFTEKLVDQLNRVSDERINGVGPEGSSGSIRSKELLLHEQEKIEGQPDFFFITILDETNSIMTEDSDTGMTEIELVKNRSTIATSGTKASMESRVAGGGISMTGPFGVGVDFAH